MASNLFGKKRYSLTKYNIEIQTDNTLIFSTDMGPSKNKELKYQVHINWNYIPAEYRGAVQKAALYFKDILNWKVLHFNVVVGGMYANNHQSRWKADLTIDPDSHYQAGIFVTEWRGQNPEMLWTSDNINIV